MATDPFEDVFNLEDQFYQEGYQQGAADGAQAGKVEGRAFGLEKGFEKFAESGRLYGRSLVWGNRLPRPPPTQDTKEGDASKQRAVETCLLPSLSANPRLKKNIVTLHALVESETLSTENTDEAVNDFDDRLKRAQGKARIIEKMTGEQVPKTSGVKGSAVDKDVSSNEAAV